MVTMIVACVFAVLFIGACCVALHFVFEIERLKIANVLWQREAEKIIHEVERENELLKTAMKRMICDAAEFLADPCDSDESED